MFARKPFFWFLIRVSEDRRPLKLSRDPEYQL